MALYRLWGFAGRQAHVIVFSYCAIVVCINKNKIYHNMVHVSIDRENLSLGFANNPDADQPAHPCRLISTFVFCLLESIISKLATGEILIF